MSDFPWPAGFRDSIKRQQEIDKEKMGNLTPAEQREKDYYEQGISYYKTQKVQSIFGFFLTLAITAATIAMAWSAHSALNFNNKEDVRLKELEQSQKSMQELLRHMQSQEGKTTQPQILDTTTGTAKKKQLKHLSKN